MKKLLVFVTTLVIILLAMTATALAADDIKTDAKTKPNISVMLNGNEIEFVDQGAIIMQSRTMVPLRGIIQALGLEVTYTSNKEPITIMDISTGSSMTLQIGSDEINIGDETIKIEMPVPLIGSRTMVPLYIITNTIGAETKWDAKTRTAFIIYEKQEELEEYPIPFAPFTQISSITVEDEILERLLALESEFPDGTISNHCAIFALTIQSRLFGTDFDYPLTERYLSGTEYAIIKRNMPRVHDDFTDLRPGDKLIIQGRWLHAMIVISADVEKNELRVVNGNVIPYIDSEYGYVRWQTLKLNETLEKAVSVWSHYK